MRDVFLPFLLFCAVTGKIIVSTEKNGKKMKFHCEKTYPWFITTEILTANHSS